MIIQILQLVQDLRKIMKKRTAKTRQCVGRVPRLEATAVQRTQRNKILRGFLRKSY